MFDTVAIATDLDTKAELFPAECAFAIPGIIDESRVSLTSFFELLQ